MGGGGGVNSSGLRKLCPKPPLGMILVYVVCARCVFVFWAVSGPLLDFGVPALRLKPCLQSPLASFRLCSFDGPGSPGTKGAQSNICFPTNQKANDFNEIFFVFGNSLFTGVLET